MPFGKGANVWQMESRFTKVQRGARGVRFPAFFIQKIRKTLLLVFMQFVKLEVRPHLISFKGKKITRGE